MNRNTDISPELFEEIERYILQAMTEEEQQFFVEKMAGDALLRDKVHITRLTILGIQESTLQNKLDEFNNELSTKVVTIEQPGKRNTIIRRLLAVAAVLLIAVLSWVVVSQLDTNNRIYSKYYKPDPGLISAMSTTDDYLFDRAMVDYKTGSYNAAIKTWESLLPLKPNDDTLNYFVGSAYLAKKETAKAIFYLQKVVAIQSSYFYKDACWYLGLALLKEDKVKEALPYLQKADHSQKEQLLKSLHE